MPKQALISPNEPRESGYRVAQVEPDGQTFAVGAPLFWTPCADDVVADHFWYDPSDQLILPIPPAPIPVPSAENNKNTAIGLLSATDWATIPDVGNPAMSNPYLSNQAEFITYRNAVRHYAVYPVSGNITWPVAPQEDWKTV